MEHDATKLLERFDADQRKNASPLEEEIARLNAKEFQGTAQLLWISQQSSDSEPERDPLISALLSSLL